MTNQDYIDAYKNNNVIISDYYKLIQNNKVIDFDGIINPYEIDNRQFMSPTDNQKDSPHCAGYSAATLVESIYWKKTGKLKQLDAHQVYALAKQLDGQQYSEGTYLETSIDAILKLCKNDKDFEFLNTAKYNTFFNDKTRKTIEQVKHLIHQYNFLQVGFNIDQGWFNCNNSNYILKPAGASLGGHAVNLCGYDSIGFFILNQWSTTFGAKGYAIIPYELFLKQFMYGAYIYNYMI